jgi:hypothetical protein
MEMENGRTQASCGRVLMKLEAQSHSSTCGAGVCFFWGRWGLPISVANLGTRKNDKLETALVVQLNLLGLERKDIDENIIFFVMIKVQWALDSVPTKVRTVGCQTYTSNYPGTMLVST